MNKELEIQKYIKAHGLDETVTTFKLKVNDYGHKILLKYDQIESDFSKEEVREARGLILEKGTWNVMSFIFKKFFNYGEGHADKIDWNKAIVYIKLDGSLLQLYFDWIIGEWCAGTTGTANGEGEVNKKENTNFAQLFWRVAESCGLDKTNLRKDLCYGFELTTPYNIVVTPHGRSRITLLGARNVKTLVEENDLEKLSYQIGIPSVLTFDFKDISYEMLYKLFENMPFTEEGYVVSNLEEDGIIKRIKIKNPAYVAVHHLKSKLGEYHIMSVIKTNEVDEFIATFPERAEEIERLKEGFNNLIIKMESIKEILYPLIKNNVPRKEYALKVFQELQNNNLDKSFSGCFFGILDGRIENVREFLRELDDKKLYYIL